MGKIKAEVMNVRSLLQEPTKITLRSYNGLTETGYYILLHSILSCGHMISHVKAVSEGSRHVLLNIHKDVEIEMNYCLSGDGSLLRHTGDNIITNHDISATRYCGHF